MVGLHWRRGGALWRSKAELREQELAERKNRKYYCNRILGVPIFYRKGVTCPPRQRWHECKL
ncbi:pollen-specific leucine-rich repeat extensin-like protein 4 [Iris pallida]|uniref:Pollen-specific leucine-rich repeat extensin-like protein 4 n=1 Tax=Iris pallida TaxID=29817 RepID=A0AAX6HPC4_IRIPA|nr:pollen-specific leucine-rich repeat extensin-like protein 4 [Iris pallida]KAJ6842573.1 pollen-specific leucine-rich repeat extensin-like protein 4 [Iris pallida]